MCSLKKNAVAGTTASAIDELFNHSLPDPNISSKEQDKLSIRIDAEITVLSSLEKIERQFLRDNTFENPIFKSNELNNRSNWNVDSTIETYRFGKEGLVLPRGYMRDLLRILQENNITPQIIDGRVTHHCHYPDGLNEISLRPYQQTAVDQAMEVDQGVIISPTGSGKSLIGLEIIRQRQQKSLIIVHRSDLAHQWIRVIKERLGITAGFIGDGAWTVGNEITVALIQTLSSKGDETRALSNTFGLILCDEHHHTPCESFYEVLSLLAAKFRYGLSASAERRDGLEQMIYRAIGPAIAIITKKEVEDIGATVPATVISVRTGFNPGFVSSWHEYLDALTSNADRNLLIIDLAQHADGSALILVDRVSHAENLSAMLTRRNIDHVLAHGRIGKKDRECVMDRIKSAKLTIGTTSLLGEGIDVASWSVLIMASPISSEIKLMQAVGRIVRPAPGKRNALVYDLKDDCAFAGASFKKRFEIYKKNGVWVDFRKAG